MTLAQRLNRLTMNFSERIPNVKRRISVCQSVYNEAIQMTLLVWWSDEWVTHVCSICIVKQMSVLLQRKNK